MKQIIITDKTSYSSSNTEIPPKGALTFRSLKDYTTVTSKPTDNFCIILGRGDGKMPINFPEVDVKSLRVSRASYQEGTTCEFKFTIPTPEKGKHYTFLVSKKGVVFNERNNWTFTVPAKDESSATVAADIVKAVNANSLNLGMTASNTGGVITFTATKVGADYNVQGADELMGLEYDSYTAGKKAVLDKAYVQDLASRCAAGKGFDYTDNPEIYPGYPEVVSEDKYVLYTLRFAVSRVYGKQLDEVVSQLVHICVPEGSDSIATLDSIFDVSETSTTSAGGGILSEDCDHHGIIGNVDHDIDSTLD